MPENKDRLFVPGATIELVCGLHSDSPEIRPAIIHDTKPAEGLFGSSQTRPPLSIASSQEELHVTRLVVSERKEKVRRGIAVRVRAIQRHDYSLKGGFPEELVWLESEGPVVEINVRSAYRLTPGRQFPVFAQMRCGDEEYVCGRDFSILDISTRGMGLVALPEKGEGRPALLNLENGACLALGMALHYPREQNLPARKVVCLGKVVRKKDTSKGKTGILGLHFTKLLSRGEDDLHHFIHEAQLTEIRQLSPYR